MENIMIPGLCFFTAVIWGWSLVDLIRSRFENRTIKGLWLIVVFFLPLIGPIVYFQFKERRKFQPEFS